MDNGRQPIADCQAQRSEYRVIDRQGGVQTFAASARQPIGKD